MFFNLLAQVVINTPVPYPSKKQAKNFEYLQCFNCQHEGFKLIRTDNRSFMASGDIPSQVSQLEFLLLA